MKSISLAAALALVLSACGGQKGDPLPQNPNTNAGLPLIQINGVSYKPPVEQGVFTNVRGGNSLVNVNSANSNTSGGSTSNSNVPTSICPGNICVQGDKLQYATYGIQARDTSKITPFISETSEAYLTPADKMPGSGRAFYRGNAFTSTFGSGSDDSDTVIGSTNRGHFNMEVDFAQKKVLSGRLQFVDAIISKDKEAADAGQTAPAVSNPSAPVAPNTQQEDKVYSRDYILGEAKIVGNQYEGLAAMGNAVSIRGESGNINSNASSHPIKGSYHGYFFGPDAEETAGKVIMNSTAQDHSAAFGGQRR